MPSQNTITCSKCKESKGTTTVRLKKLIKQYGSQKKLDEQYVCRSCKSGIKPSKGKKKGKLTTSKVTCSKCNKKFGTTKDRMKKLIAQYGSLEEVHSTYVCRKCRKELNVDRRGKMKPVKRKRKPKITSNYERDTEGNIVLPAWMKNMKHARECRQPATAADLKSVGACWRPDIYVGNKKIYKQKCCNGCPCIERDSCGCKQVIIEEKKTKKKIKKA